MNDIPPIPTDDERRREWESRGLEPQYPLLEMKLRVLLRESRDALKEAARGLWGDEYALLRLPTICAELHQSVTGLEFGADTPSSISTSYEERAWGRERPVLKIELAILARVRHAELLVAKAQTFIRADAADRDRLRIEIEEFSNRLELEESAT